jgi:hypothetical protein
MNCITIAVEEAPKQSTAGLVVEVKAWKIVVVRKENKTSPVIGYYVMIVYHKTTFIVLTIFILHLITIEFYNKI